MTPSELLSKITQFATANKKMLLSVVGGIAATGIIAGAIMYTSGTVLQGSLTQVTPDPTVTTTESDLVALATTCTVGDTQTQACTLTTTGAAGTQSRTCLRENYWGSWSPCTVPTPAPATCTSFTYSEWGTECLRGNNFRSILTSSPEGCEGGDPILSRACVTEPVACTSYTYSDWSTCVNGSQSRTVTSSKPTGCTGGTTPVLTQSCTSEPPAGAGSSTGTATGTSSTGAGTGSSPTGSSTGTATGTGTGSSAGSSADTEIQEEAPTACTGKNILTCSAMSDVLYLSDKIPLRLNCSITANGIVSSQVIKGAISDPNQAQAESAIMKKLMEKKSYSGTKSQPKGFYMLFDGLNAYDSPVDEGDYSIFTTARVSASAAPDCSVQKFKVVKERPQVESQQDGAGTQGTSGGQESAATGASPATNGEATSGESASATAPEPEPEPEIPPEPSKCPGVNYPKDVKGHWAENLIRQAYDTCMFKGYEDGTFSPDRPITRAEALKTILSAAKITPILDCYDADCGSPFMDLEMWQGPWARAAWNLQIVKGAEKFRPSDAVTRAEAAIMVANAFIKSGKITTPLLTNCYTPNCGAGYPDNFFMDITEKWQGPAIRWLWDNGLTQGRAPGRFEPDSLITRAELTKLVMTAAGK